MYQHINSTTTPKGESKTAVHVNYVNPYKAHPAWDGEDVVCCNCGHILGWCSQEEMPKCPACGVELDWSDDE